MPRANFSHINQIAKKQKQTLLPCCILEKRDNPLQSLEDVLASQRSFPFPTGVQQMASCAV